LNVIGLDIKYIAESAETTGFVVLRACACWGSGQRPQTADADGRSAFPGTFRIEPAVAECADELGVFRKHSYSEKLARREDLMRYGLAQQNEPMEFRH
jgi:hypothetical protein